MFTDNNAIFFFFTRVLKNLVYILNHSFKKLYYFWNDLFFCLFVCKIKLKAVRESEIFHPLIYSQNGSSQSGWLQPGAWNSAVAQYTRSRCPSTWDTTFCLTRDLDLKWNNQGLYLLCQHPEWCISQPLQNWPLSYCSIAWIVMSWISR